MAQLGERLPAPGGRAGVASVRRHGDFERNVAPPARLHHRLPATVLPDRIRSHKPASQHGMSGL